MDFPDCAAVLAREFTDDIFTDNALKTLCRDAYGYSVPMVTSTGARLDPAMPVQADHFFLELFHGPTLAFKDFAARFMGRAASHLMRSAGQRPFWSPLRAIQEALSGTLFSVRKGFPFSFCFQMEVCHRFKSSSSVRLVDLTPMCTPCR